MPAPGPVPGPVPDPATHITTHLLTSKCLPLSPTWLHTFLSSSPSSTTTPNPSHPHPRPPNIPLAALTQTATFRVLASDILTSLSTADASRLLPLDVASTATRERTLPGDVVVQVLDVVDVGHSRWGQIEEMERVERGETVRGREVVRTVDVEGTRRGEGEGSGNGGNGGRSGGGEAGGGPFALVLQDARGTKVKAFERRRVEGLGMPKAKGERGFAMGAKMVLRKGTVVGRGCVMLEGERCVVLGGKIKGLDKAWRRERKARLVRELEGREGGERDASGGGREDALMIDAD